jgi:hypothetical protein
MRSAIVTMLKIVHCLLVNVICESSGLTTNLIHGETNCKPEISPSMQYHANFAKIWFASSSVSFDPMSYQIPGTRHV